MSNRKSKKIIYKLKTMKYIYQSEACITPMSPPGYTIVDLNIECGPCKAPGLKIESHPVCFRPIQSRKLSQSSHLIFQADCGIHTH
jgi:hypothetical protein